MTYGAPWEGALVNDAHSAPYGSGGPDDGRDPYGQDPYRSDGYARRRGGADARGYPQDPYAAEPYPADAYGQQQYGGQQQGGQTQGGYDPYGPQAPAHDSYGRQQYPPRQTYAPAAPPQQPPRPPQQPPAQAPRHPGGSADEQQWVPQQRPERPGPEPRPAAPGRPGGPDVPGDAGYRTEQFAFVEDDPDEGADDVIDWLKFAETRTERRDERKRKNRNRVIALVVVLVLAAASAVGYLWYTGKIPGMVTGAAAGKQAGAVQKRDVVVVHLRDTKGRGSATALLVDNETMKQGTTVLLPNSTRISTEDGGATTLAKSVEDEGAQPTREALGTLLGADIKGTWRLDTPYLENLVELVGGITVHTDAEVPAAKKGEDPLVKRGRSQSLNGQAAVGYATLSRPGEPQTKQLERFGQVMHAVLRKISSEPEAATTTVRSLSQIPDPSLSEAQLGALLARLGEQAKTGAYSTELLPVQPDGALGEAAKEGLVKDVLGGTVRNTDGDAAPRIGVRNATGNASLSNTARADLVNGGYTYVDGGTADAALTRSQVLYADAAMRSKAVEAAKTLGLPATAVTKGRVAANADVTVVLGSDYRAG